MESPKKNLYFENLDGWRAVAAFAVIFAHISYQIKDHEKFAFALKAILSFGGVGGRLGVIFFFILSGFLITYLLFTENKSHGKIQIGSFYLRRVLRIWPLYYLTLLIGFVILPLFKDVGAENSSPLLYSLFLANFDHIYNGFPTLNTLGVQWSVCIEEQFYIVWPLLFWLMQKTKSFVGLTILLIISSEMFFIVSGIKMKSGDYHFISCFKYLAIGGLLANWAFYHQEKMVQILSFFSKHLTLAIYIFSLGFIFLQHKILGHFSIYPYIFHVVPALFFSFVIIEQNFSPNSFFKMGKFKILTWLGKISYGLYLTHMIGINIALLILKDIVNIWYLIPMSLFFTITISYLSYHYFEAYFLKLKKSFSKVN